MSRYLLTRLGQAVFVLWAAYTLAFFLLSALPGDGIMIKFESPELGLSADEIAAIREHYGVHDPVIVQYLRSLLDALRGDFGYSIVNAAPVSERIAAALPQTLQLALWTFPVAVLLAVGIALASTYARAGWLRHLVDSVPSVFSSFPTFWLALILIQIVSFQLALIPMIGASPEQALILPVIALAVPLSAPLAQMLCRGLEDANRLPFVQVATAKGAHRWWLLTRHTAKNAVLPTLTIAGLIFGEILAGSVVIETVFGRNGLGRLINDSVSLQDLPVIQAVVVIAALVFVTVNLLVDLVFPALDPRLRSTIGLRRRRRPVLGSAVSGETS